MGKSILTSKQLDFLEFVQTQTSITKRFYFTGGTALAAVYLHHRISEDIDLFSEQEVNPSVVESFLKGISQKLGIVKIIKENFLGLYTYKLHYKDGESLKIDFNYYPFSPIEKGTYFGKLAVSSIYDIAVNKIHTITMRSRARDYVDLYFIFQKNNSNPAEFLGRIRLDSQAKFDWPLEVKNLVVAFLKVKDLKDEDFPRMLVPFDKNKMEEFFLSLAKSLEGEIFDK